MKKDINIQEFPRVSIIILNYNGKRFLHRCLSSLLKSDYPDYEVIFVDNNSTDGSVKFVLQHFKNMKNLKIIKLSKNYGFSIGNNIGAKHAEGNYLAFLNPDTEANPNWLKKLVEVMNSDSSIGVAQPKLLLIDSKRFDTAGCFLNPYGLTWSRGSEEEDKGQYDKIKEIFYAKGAALIIRRDLWSKLGGFDPIFFIYYEETDLCWRAWNHGYKVVYVPEAKVFHFGGAVLKNIPYHVKYHEARGRPILLIKNYSPKNVFRYVPLTIILQLLNAIRQLLKGSLSSALAVVKGTVWCIIHFGKTWRARKVAERSIKNQDRRRVFRLMKKNVGFTLG